MFVSSAALRSYAASKRFKKRARAQSSAERRELHAYKP
jgi:hypothetical protein